MTCATAVLLNDRKLCKTCLKRGVSRQMTRAVRLRLDSDARWPGDYSAHHSCARGRGGCRVDLSSLRRSSARGSGENGSHHHQRTLYCVEAFFWKQEQQISFFPESNGDAPRAPFFSSMISITVLAGPVSSPTRVVDALILISRISAHGTETHAHACMYSICSPP